MRRRSCRTLSVRYRLPPPTASWPIVPIRDRPASGCNRCEAAFHLIHPYAIKADVTRIRDLEIGYRIDRVTLTGDLMPTKDRVGLASEVTLGTGRQDRLGARNREELARAGSVHRNQDHQESVCMTQGEQDPIDSLVFK